MERSRSVFGVLALVCLAVALNVLLLKEDLFAFWVVAGLAGGLVAGAVWLVLVFIGMARSQEGANRLYGLNSALACVLFLGICIVLFAFAKHWDQEWDLTREGRRELAPQTVQVLEALNQDVSVICFFLKTPADDAVEVARDKARRFLERCQKHTPRLHVEFLDPQQDILRFRDLKLTRVSMQGTVAVRCNGRQRVITLQGTRPRLEERDFTNALVNVVRDAQAKVCFLTGHGERRITDRHQAAGYSLLKDFLEREAYTTEEIAIKLTDPEVPRGCDILVLNSPEMDIHPREVAAIQEYLDGGGRMLVLLDPQQRVPTAYRQIEQLCPWLEERYGIVIGYDLIISTSSKTEMVLSPNLGLFEGDTSAVFHGCYNYSHPITQGFEEQMLLQPARSVSLKDALPPSVAGRQLLRTLPDTWAETDLDLLPTVSQDPDEQVGPLGLAVAVTAKNDAPVNDGEPAQDARIVVVGNATFASNGQVASPPGNLNFVLNAVAWLSEKKELIAIRPTAAEDPPVILSEGEEQAVAWISTLGVLQLVIVAGLVAYRLRRKYQ